MAFRGNPSRHQPRSAIGANWGADAVGMSSGAGPCMIARSLRAEVVGVFLYTQHGRGYFRRKLSNAHTLEMPPAGPAAFERLRYSAVKVLGGCRSPDEVKPRNRQARRLLCRLHENRDPCRRFAWEQVKRQSADDAGRQRSRTADYIYAIRQRQGATVTAWRRKPGRGAGPLELVMAGSKVGARWTFPARHGRWPGPCSNALGSQSMERRRVHVRTQQGQRWRLRGLARRRGDTDENRANRRGGS